MSVMTKIIAKFQLSVSSLRPTEMVKSTSRKGRPIPTTAGLLVPHALPVPNIPHSMVWHCDSCLCHRPNGPVPIREHISCRRSRLLSHMACLDPSSSHHSSTRGSGLRHHTPHEETPPSGWKRLPGRPWSTCVQQIGDGSTSGIQHEWNLALGCGSSGVYMGLRASTVQAFQRGSERVCALERLRCRNRLVTDLHFLSICVKTMQIFAITAHGIAYHNQLHLHKPQHKKNFYQLRFYFSQR